MTSRFALVAAAGLLVGATVAPAKAADLGYGGGCCADLEERVAELEATTARKGNRVVSLQVYGQVNKALLFFDTDIDSDTFVVDNDASGSRIGFTGSAAIRPGVTAGYKIELDIQDAASNQVDQFDNSIEGFNGDDPDDEIKIRHNYVYIESEQFGRFSIGHQSTATDGIAGITLGNTLSTAAPDHGTSLFVGFSNVQLGDLASDLDGPREDVIKYDSPSLYGFILSAAWGDDDFYDVALRFKKEWNSIRFAAGVGYQNEQLDFLGVDGEETEIVSGSASVMHVPTGLFLSAAAGSREIEGDDAGEYWYVQGGIEKRFLSYGSTTVYAEYGDYDDFATAEFIDIDSSNAERFGFGVVQSIDSAAMDIYTNINFWDTEIDGEELGDVTTVMGGMRIKF